MHHSDRLDDRERATLRTVADYQFGAGAGDALFDGPLRVTRSRTGRIRQVYAFTDGAAESSADGDDATGGGVDHFADPAARLVSLGRDGRFTVGLAGGERLVAALEPPGARVVVGDESAPFVADGKNAFAKFVRNVDPAVRSRDEVAVVHADGRLLAVGRAELDAGAMADFETGMAVKVRDGVGEDAVADLESS
ncbi:MAG: PUA domain-containing protein [Halobacteriaceae archaeon]